MRNIPLYCVNMYLGDRLYKGGNWPIAGQEKVRQENQNKNTGKKKGRVRGVTGHTERGNRRYKMKERLYHMAECRLI